MTSVNIARILTTQLAKWAQSADRKPLLLRGARQVGKSWAVREWAKISGINLVEINFEEEPRYAALFEENLDIERIINDISTSLNTSLRAPNTAIFFDEIQRAPRAITSLRYFYEKTPQVMILSAGSLVEFVLEEHGLPVGRVQSQFVFPLSFSEFLTAIGKHGLAEKLDSFSFETLEPFSPLIHQELLSQLKLYYQIGGMPKVVSTYLITKDMNAVSTEQQLLLRGYSDDLRKYAKKADWSLLETIFQKMAEIAGGSPVKFSTIDPLSRSSQIRRALLTLQQGLILHRILPTHARELPLAAGAVDKRFKVSFLDIGLLHQILGFDWNLFEPGVDLTAVASGRFAEQFVAQEIITNRSMLNNYSLHYWARNRAGADAEVDFVIEYRNIPVPVEVKSGAAGRLRSLQQYIKEFNPAVAFVLSQRNIERVGNILFLPLYLAGRL